jgi:hypothetical protein
MRSELGCSRGGAVAGDQRRRELPLAADDLGAVALEHLVFGFGGAQLLALGDERGDVLLDSRDVCRMRFHTDIYDAAGQQPAALLT